MAKTSPSVAGLVAGAVTLGVGLHTLHEAVDGYEWAARYCLCRFGPARK
jgi:hypothetical protein